MKVNAGIAQRGDIRITLTPTRADGVNIELTSSVARLYGNAIKTQIADELERLGVENALVEAVDDGALPYVVRARIAAAAQKLGQTLPKTKSRTKTTSPDALRRSRLYLPGNNPYLVQNARLFGADMLLLDLEDSVPPAEKEDTRILVRYTVAEIDFGRAECAVRINPLSSPYGEDDLVAIVPAAPDVILIPKAETAEDVSTVAEMVEKLSLEAGLDKTIYLFPIVESAKGVVHAYEIATASERVVSLAFGAEDYTKDIGATRTRDGRETLFARQSVVNAAKAAMVQASDTVWSDLDDEEGLIASATEGRAFGFDGKGAIHPAQIAPIHRAYTPTADEIAYARRVIEAASEAEKNGLGVVAFGRKMIDPPIIARARRVLDLATKIGLEG